MNCDYNPKVSIIIPVYNGANFLSEAIDSALAQTYKNIEIIVVNDGSTDNGETERIAKSYGDKIRYFYKENGGVSSALNLGIREMTGEWFSWLSHDDLYLPGKVEHSVDVLKSYSDCSGLIVISDGILVNEDKKKIKSFKSCLEPNKIYVGSEVADIMTKTGAFCGCALLIPKAAFLQIGMFNESLRYSQDALMWYLLFINGYKLCFSKYKDVLSRVHKKQVTNTRKELFYKDSLYVAKTISELLIKQSNSVILYNYTKRLTKLNCGETVDYLIEFSAMHGCFSSKQLLSLKIYKMLGKLIYIFKNTIRCLILR